MKSSLFKICVKVLFNILWFTVYALLVGLYAYYLKKAVGAEESLIITCIFATIYLLYILLNKYISSKIVSQSTVEVINISTLLLWVVIILSNIAFENHLFKGGISIFF